MLLVLLITMFSGMSRHRQRKYPLVPSSLICFLNRAVNSRTLVVKAIQWAKKSTIERSMISPFLCLFSSIASMSVFALFSVIGILGLWE